MEKTKYSFSFSKSRSLEIVLQTEFSECGLACIAMIANYHGHDVDLNSLRRKHSVSSSGATLKSLINIADKLFLLSRPIQIDLKELNRLECPCVLHWNLSHFVVLKEVKKNTAVIYDPAKGVYNLTIEEVSKRFTGIALELLPSHEFIPEKTAKKAKLSHFWNKIHGLKNTAIQILILSILLQLLSLASPFFLQLSIDEVVVSQDTSLLTLLALGFGLLMLINILVTALRSSIILNVGAQLNIQMAVNLLRHLLRLPMKYFESRHIGDIVSRFSSLENIKNLLTTGIVEAIVDGLMSIGLLILMFIYSPLLTVIVLISVVIYMLIRLVFFKPYKQLNEELIVTDAKQNSNFMETVRGIQSIKLFSNEPQRQAIWHNYYTDALNADVRVGKLNIIYTFAGGLLFGLENILIIYIGVTEVVDNLLSVGMLYAYISYKLQFTRGATALIDKLIDFKMLTLHLERLGDIVLSPKEEGLDSCKSGFEIKGNIEFKNLSFRYSETEPYIFKDVDLKIVKGSSVAIVGPSGAGKTTLLKVLLGLLKPVSGEVKIDGVELNKIGMIEYRKNIGTVMQNDQLFSGSVADNICFFESDYNQDLIEKCAKMASIHNDIEKMPMEYYTLIGDMGSSLSGGQKQRILLSRALYKKPKILFLDEATSHLDVGIESIVNDTIKELSITRVIIAHRKETIAMADYVFELKNGKLKPVENGLI